MRDSIRNKLGLGFTIVFAVVALCGILIIHMGFRKSAFDRMEQAALFYLNTAFDYARMSDTSGSLHRNLGRIASIKGVEWIVVFDVDTGEVVGSSRYAWNGKSIAELSTETKDVVESLESDAVKVATVPGAFYFSRDSFLVDTIDGRLIRRNLRAIGRFDVRYELAATEPYFLAVIFVLLGAGILLFGFLFWVVTSLVVRRVERLKMLMEQGTRIEMDGIAEDKSSDEIGSLFSSYASMLEELDAQNNEITKLARVAALTDNGVLISDVDERITWVNEGFINITGYSRDELIGRKPGDFLQGEKTDPEMRRYMRESVAERIPFSAGVINYTKLGAEYFIEIDAQPIFENEEFLGYIAVERDETERYLYEKRLKLAKEEADAANVAKSAFLAAMSHEIRTPMNGVIGIVNLLENTDLNAEQRQMTEIIQRSGESLMTVINDILDYSKIESGELNIAENTFFLDQVLDSPLLLFVAQCEQKGIELCINYKCVMPREVCGDDNRIRQILFNLIGNAIKFTDKGFVEVVFDCKKTNESEVRLICSVIDTGMGIPEKDHEQLFSRFYQASNQKAKHIKGTGLGLAIVKNLCEIMGGSVGFISSEGEGTSFTFEIPLKVVEWGFAETGIEHFQGVTYYLGLQDSATRRCIEGRLSVLGLNECGNALEADLLIVSSSNEEFAHVSKPVIQLLPFSDANVIDEANVCRAPHTSKDFRGVLSAALGFQLYSEHPSEHHGAEKTTAKDLSKLSVLVAEDSQINQKVIRMMLKKLGLDPVIVSNGLEAVKAFKAEFYDLVLLDIHMPIMDGYTASNQIRELEQGDATKIAALSAGVLAEEESEAMSHKMDAFLSKPVRPHEILTLMERFFVTQGTSGIAHSSVRLPL